MHFWTYLPCPCNLAPFGDHNGKGGENIVRPEELAFLRQDQTKLLRQSIQELEATLRDQQQESRMWQNRLDLVPDQVLSNECIEDKDDAYYAGKDLHWVPSPRCTLCHRIRTSLQEPMPEHASPPPDSKTPCPIIKTKKTPLIKKKNVRSPVHRHYSSYHAFRRTHALVASTPRRPSWDKAWGCAFTPSHSVRSLPSHPLVHQKGNKRKTRPTQ